MNRSETEKITDELIGEAVLSLLKEHGPVTKQSLAKRLQDMAARESDPRRCEALAAVILEINASNTPFAQRKRARPQRELNGRKSEQNDNVYPLFGDGKPGGRNNIH